MLRNAAEQHGDDVITLEHAIPTAPSAALPTRTQNQNDAGLLLHTLGGAGEEKVCSLSWSVTLRRSMIVYSLASLSLCCDSRAYANAWPRRCDISSSSSSSSRDSVLLSARCDMVEVLSRVRDGVNSDPAGELLRGRRSGQDGPSETEIRRSDFLQWIHSVDLNRFTTVGRDCVQ